MMFMFLDLLYISIACRLLSL